MYREAYGIDLSEKYIKAATHKRLRVKGGHTLRHYVSLNELFPETEGSYKDIINWDLIENDPHIVHVKLKSKTGDSVGPARKGYKPVATFLIRGSSYEEVYEKSMYLQRNVQVVVG